MNKVIYISAGTVAASVNVVNAKCSCKDDKGNEDVKKLPENLAIVVNGVEYVNIDNQNKSDFSRCEAFKDTFKFEKSDIGRNVSCFIENNGSYDFIVVVGSKAIVDQQKQETKNNNINPLGNTGCFVCCIENSSNLLVKSDFTVEADKSVKGKFIITATKP